MLKRSFWSIAILIALIEIYSVRPHAPGEIQPNDPGIKHFLPGAIHVHTKHSDGSGDVAEIAQAAKRAGLEFVVVTDLDTSQARKEEGSYDQVDVFIEMEATTTAGILLTFYSHTDAVRESDEKVRQIAWQHFQGNKTYPELFNIVAHPSHPKKPWNAFDRNPEGVEIFNFDSLWQKARNESTIGSGITLFTYPWSNFLAALRFSQTNRKDLTSWDAMNAISPGRFGVLAQHSLASSHLGPLHLKWPSYEQAFKVGTTVLFYEPPLATDFQSRKAQLYRLLREGRSAMVFNYLHPFHGNDWTIECDSGVYRSGERLTSPKNCEFVVRLPKSLDYDATLRLWRSGELASEVQNAGAETRIPVSGPGAYRLEVWLRISTLFRVLLSGEVPYLFYNPIYVQ